MSAPDKPDPAKAWLLAERLLDEDADRMADLIDEEFEREIDAMPDPPRVPSVEELLARGQRRARERQAQGVGLMPPRPKRIAWGRWLGAAGLGAAVVTIVTEREELAALLRHDTSPIGPLPEGAREGGHRSGTRWEVA